MHAESLSNRLLPLPPAQAASAAAAAEETALWAAKHAAEANTSAARAAAVSAAQSYNLVRPRQCCGAEAARVGGTADQSGCTA